LADIAFIDFSAALMLNKNLLKSWIKATIKIVIATIILSILCFFLLYFLIQNKPAKHISFNSQVWQEETNSCVFLFLKNSQRKRMYADLKKILLKTPTYKVNVIQLLGDPELFKQQQRWSYHSGSSTMDCMSLDIEFDQQEKVIAVQLFQH